MKRDITIVKMKWMDMTITGLEVVILNLFYIVQILRLKNETWKWNRKKLRNLQELIVNDAYRRKEKVIAIDSETFEEVRGKEVRLKISNAALEAMREELTK